MYDGEVKLGGRWGGGSKGQGEGRKGRGKLRLHDVLAPAVKLVRRLRGRERGCRICREGK